MIKSSLSWARGVLVLAIVAAAFVGSRADSADASGQSFLCTTTATGTATGATYPDQPFDGAVTTVGTENWVEHGALLGEWTIERWGYAENAVVDWAATGGTVITGWGYTQHDLGWQYAQGWDTTPDWYQSHGGQGRFQG